MTSSRDKKDKGHTLRGNKKYKQFKYSRCHRDEVTLYVYVYSL